MLLRSGKNEDGMLRRFFQRFQESVECGGGKHVYLVDDIHFVSAYLGRYPHLLYQAADVFHGVVGSCVQLVDVVGALFVEGEARFAFVARFSVFRRMQAVDGFREDARARGFSHSARPAEQVGVRQLLRGDSVLERSGQRALAYYRVESGGAVFPRRYDIIFHQLYSFLLRLFLQMYIKSFSLHGVALK